jgi:hypothetical protein
LGHWARRQRQSYFLSVRILSFSSQYWRFLRAQQVLWGA